MDAQTSHSNHEWHSFIINIYSLLTYSKSSHLAMYGSPYFARKCIAKFEIWLEPFM